MPDPRRAARSARAALLAVSALALGTAACIQTRSARIAPSGSVGVVRTARPERVWKVLTEGETLGVVVLFASQQDRAESFFSVRNEWHQERGLIDSLGRAWRFLPHEREARHVTTGTVLEGAAALLDADGDCALLETELSELENVPAARLRDGTPGAGNGSTPNGGALERGFIRPLG